MQVHRFSNRLKTSLWGNKSKYPRFPIHSTLLLPNTISFPKASCNLRTCEAVFAVKSSSMFTFLFSMFTFSRVNVHFFRFFKSAADVQYPVMKRMILVQQEISFVPYRRRFCTRLKECNRVFPGNTPKQHAFSHSPNSRLKSRECGE